MKVSCKLWMFLGHSGYESRAMKYVYIYIVAVILLLWQFFTTTHVIYDTQSYYIAADKLMNGEWDAFRTPVYPAIIAIGKILLGPRGYYITIGVQVSLFLLSAVILQRLSLSLSESRKATFWVVSAYLLLISFSAFPVLLLTDSLGISIMVLLMWFILRKYPSTPTVLDLSFASVILLILVFLRPFFIYLIPVLAVYYFSILCVQRRVFKASFMTGMLGLLIVVGCVQAYRSVMYKNFGIQSISIVSSINNYFPVRAAVEPNPELTSNLEMKVYLQGLKKKEYQHDSIIHEVLDLQLIAGYREFEAYVNKQVSQNKRIVLKKIVGRALHDARRSVYFPPYYSENRINQELSWHLPSITVYFLFIIMYAIGVLKIWLHNRQIPLPSLFLLMITLGATCASIIGAQGEWARLSLPGFPALLIMIAITIPTISIDLKRYYKN